MLKKDERMEASYRIRIVTPKRFLLDGIWFGAKKPKQLIVWVHGLSSSCFSMSYVVNELADSETAVITFNNRGFEGISKLKRAGKQKWQLVGAAHEKFTDCIDDIQGAVNFARRAGVKNIYLAGHSTGCQKSVYWASRKSGGRAVKGIILLAPVSDWAAETKLRGKKKIERVANFSRTMIRRGKGRQILPENIWHETLDAQRFLSLYTSDSIEEIFTYAQPKKDPRTLKKARVPVLALLAEKDEFLGRPIGPVREWFGNSLKRNDTVAVIPRVKHSFRGGEKVVAREVRKFIAAH